MPPSNATLQLYQKITAWPLGHWLFSKVICFKAPYFASISAGIRQLDNGHCETFLRKRRKVTNHIGTVHAIACCNLAELTAGMVMEASIPPNMRWIPKGMTVSYLAKAGSDLRAETRLAQTDWQEAQEVVVPVSIYDTGDIEVVRADITMWVSPRK